MAGINDIPTSECDPKRPVPPESVIDWNPAKVRGDGPVADAGSEDAPAPSASAGLTGEEPFDTLGVLSMCFGLLALLMTPVATTFAAPSLWAFAIAAIAFGSIRLLDGRFAKRSDMAVAGIISALIVVGFLLVVSTQRAIDASVSVIEDWDEDVAADASYDELTYEDYGYDSHGYGRRHRSGGGFGGDSISDTLDEFDGTMEKFDESTGKLKGDDGDKDEDEDADDTKADDKADEADKGKADEDASKVKGEEEGKEDMKQVPLADSEKDSIKRVPLADGYDGTTHQA